MTYSDHRRGLKVDDIDLLRETLEQCWSRPMTEQPTESQKWYDRERFQVVLCFNPDKASDEDLRKLISDAAKLLGQPVGHEYAIEAISCIIGIFTTRAQDRRWHIENNEKIRPILGLPA